MASSFVDRNLADDLLMFQQLLEGCRVKTNGPIIFPISQLQTEQMDEMTFEKGSVKPIDIVSSLENIEMNTLTNKLSLLGKWKFETRHFQVTDAALFKAPPPMTVELLCHRLCINKNQEIVIKCSYPAGSSWV